MVNGSCTQLLMTIHTHKHPYTEELQLGLRYRLGQPAGASQTTLTQTGGKAFQWLVSKSDP